MKRLLLLFSLLFCLGVQAKKKVYTTKIDTETNSLKTLENNGLQGVNDPAINQGDGVYSSSPFSTPLDDIFYFNDQLGNYGEGFGFSENSYKFRNSESSGLGNIARSNLAVFNNASIDSATIFRQGLFYGFALMLVLLNLVCFFLFEEKTFLFYSLALASMSLLLFFSDGLLQLIGFDATENIVNSQTLFMLIATGFGALFVTKYLTLKEFLPKLKYLSATLIGLAGTFLVMGWLSDNPAFVLSANVILFTVMGVYFMAGVYLFSKKNYAKFYVIATFIPLLFCVDYFALKPLGINFLGTQTMHIKAAAIAEMLIITYAIMYRMQAIKEENILRQAELRIFLKRQEVHSVRKKTEKLVEDVYLENLIMHYDLDGLEIKLLQYISEGKENRKIARKLKTTEHDIEELTKELYEKLEISEQIQHDYRLVDSQPDYIYN